MKKNDASKALTSFIENVHPDREWWHMMPTQGKEDHQICFQRELPLINTTFGLHTSAAMVYLMWISCLRRLRFQTQVSKNGFEEFRELVSDRRTFEKTVTTLDSRRHAHLLKLGKTEKSPIEAWKEHKNGHSSGNRTLHLSSRERTKKTMDEVMTVAKNSSEFHSMAQARTSS